MSAPSPAKGPPERIVLAGRYVRLEPIGERHVADLFRAATEPGSENRFDYLFEDRPADEAEMAAYVLRVMAADDPLLFAVVDQDSGRAEGRQALMRIVPEHGVIEIGSIYWGPRMARSRLATEALFLHAKYAFDTLGYRRFEWKCDAENAPSRRAALRFGFTFEGIFRQHMVVKHKNRDTAWFAIMDGEWPQLKARYQRWLAEDNFDAAGKQRKRLEEC